LLRKLKEEKGSRRRINRNDDKTKDIQNKISMAILTGDMARILEVISTVLDATTRITLQ
jgi:hypothetical protein